MAILWVQNAQAQSTSFAASVAVTWGSNTTTGNLIAVSVYTSATNKYNLVRTMTDGTNTYLRAGGLASGSGTMEVWYAKNITGGVTPTITATFSVPTITGNIGVAEISGIATNQPLDFYTDSIFKPPGNGTLYIGGTTPKTANNLVFYCGGQSGVTQTFVAGSGFANLQKQGTNLDTGTSATQTQINSAAVPLNATMTGASNTVIGVQAVAIFSDTDLPGPFTTTVINNYQFPKAGDGISVTEGIR